MACSLRHDHTGKFYTNRPLLEIKALTHYYESLEYQALHEFYLQT